MTESQMPYNGQGNGHDRQDDEEKIVRLPTLVERDRMRREKEKAGADQHPHPPLINLPPATKVLLGMMVAVHLVIVFALSVSQQEWVYMHLGFVPGRFTGEAPFDIWAGLSLVTHMFVHGGWLHLAMNGVMLAAFGAGIERWMGARRMVLFFLLTGLCGAACHFVLNAHSVFPVVGASGGLSGLFAAAIVMINRGRGDIGGRFGMIPFVILWIGISIAFGMIGSPDGSPIAWAAHVGGFVGGFALLKLMKI